MTRYYLVNHVYFLISASALCASVFLWVTTKNSFILVAGVRCVELRRLFPCPLLYYCYVHVDQGVVHITISRSDVPARPNGLQCHEIDHPPPPPPCQIIPHSLTAQIKVARRVNTCRVLYVSRQFMQNCGDSSAEVYDWFTFKTDRIQIYHEGQILLVFHGQDRRKVMISLIVNTCITRQLCYLICLIFSFYFKVDRELRENMWKSKGITFVVFYKNKTRQKTVSPASYLADFSFPFNQGGESQRPITYEKGVVKYISAPWCWSTRC